MREGRIGALPATLLALFFWSTLASLSLYVKGLGVFMLTGSALVIGSFWGIPSFKKIQFDLKSILIGLYGIVGFHVFYFLGLRHASVFEANLINYLWPLFIVLLTPLILKKSLNGKTIMAVLLGFIGLLIALDVFRRSQFNLEIGHLYSAFGALIWSSYSLLISKNKHSIALNSLICLIAGIICLLIAFLMGEWAMPTSHEWVFLIIIGLFPLGASFYLWEIGARILSSHKLGTLSYLTPVMSMLFLALMVGETPRIHFWIGFLIVLVSGYWAQRGET